MFNILCKDYIRKNTEIYFDDVHKKSQTTDIIRCNSGYKDSGYLVSSIVHFSSILFLK